MTPVTVAQPTASEEARPAPSDPLFMAVSLPGADAGNDARSPDAPVIAVVGRKVFVDGQPVAEIEQQDKLRRVDGLFSALKARRIAWKEAHGGAPFPGVAVFAFDATESAVVVKSVTTTAEFAGYPYYSLAVGRRGGVAYLPVDGQALRFPNARGLPKAEAPRDAP